MHVSSLCCSTLLMLLVFMSLMVNSTNQHDKNERFSTVRHLVAKPKLFAESHGTYNRHLFHWQPDIHTVSDRTNRQNKKQTRIHRQRQLMNDLHLQTNEELRTTHKHDRRIKRKDKKHERMARKRNELLRNKDNYIPMNFESKERWQRRINKKQKILSKKKNMASGVDRIVANKVDSKELDNRVVETIRNYSRADGECHCEHVCLQQNTQCDCFNGFRLRNDGRTCKDINECRENKQLCAYECQNLPGSYRCLCPDGYRPDENVCRDVNECLLNNGHGPCQDTCINTIGAYVCTCARLPGTRLAADGRSCVSVDTVCVYAGCSHECVSVRGRAHCVCPANMQLGVDWKTCESSMEQQESLNLT